MIPKLARLSDLTAYKVAHDAPMREAMERLNSKAVQHKFQMACDENGRLLGTITDGDIRRAILRGVGIDEAVSKCMVNCPIVGQLGAEEKNQKKLREISGHSAFLPVLDPARIVREVLVRADQNQDAIALIMAGGFGSRLGKRTLTTPKPLLPVGDKPILEHVLSRVEAAGASKIYISVFYLADQVEEFIRKRANYASIQIVREREPLGTAGAIGLLPQPMPGPFLIINGDILTRLDFPAFQEFHSTHHFDATIAVAQHQVTVPYGVIRMGPDGQFHGIDEKPTISHFVAAGICLLSPEFASLVRPGERLDMPDLLERGRAVGLKTGLFPIHEYWTDVGRPEDLENARVD